MSDNIWGLLPKFSFRRPIPRVGIQCVVAASARLGWGLVQSEVQDVPSSFVPFNFSPSKIGDCKANDWALFKAIAYFYCPLHSHLAISSCACLQKGKNCNCGLCFVDLSQSVASVTWRGSSVATQLPWLSRPIESTCFNNLPCAQTQLWCWSV